MLQDTDGTWVVGAISIEAPNDTGFANMSLLTITRLMPVHLSSMKDLLALFGRAFNQPETYGGAIPDDLYLARLLGKESVIVLAAVSEGAVVGGLVAYELDKFEQERREIYIYDLAVAEEHRRNGIATALIEELQRIGRSRGAYVIYVQADLEDDAAIALYSKLGVREDVLHFDIEVVAHAHLKR